MNHVISERQLARLEMKEHSEDHLLLNLPEIENKIAEGNDKKKKFLEEKKARSRKHSIEVDQKHQRALSQIKSGQSNLIQKVGEKLAKV